MSCNVCLFLNGLAHSAICLCCPCASLYSFSMGAFFVASSCCTICFGKDNQESDEFPVDEYCRWYGLYYGCIFSQTMFQDGYYKIQKACASSTKSVVVELEMSRK